MLRENRAKIGETEAKSVEEAIAEVKKAMEEGGADRINESVEKLTQASHRLTEVMYQQAQQQQPQGQPGPEPSPESGSSDAAADTKENDEVIDAEYVDVDDKK